MANQRNEMYPAPVDRDKARKVAAWFEFFRDIFNAGANIAREYSGKEERSRGQKPHRS